MPCGCRYGTVDGGRFRFVAEAFTGADRPVTTDMLRRVPVGRLTRFVERHQMIAVGGWSRAGADDWKAYVRARKRQEAKGRRRLTDDDLRRVAAVYRAALADGEAPTAAVHRELRLRSRGQAARWVKRAREEGHLGPAPGRRQQGEIRPAESTEDRR